MSEQPTTEVVSQDLAVLENEAVSTADSLRLDIISIGEGRTGVYSSYPKDDFTGAIKTVEAVNNALPISDNFGKTINLRNVVIHPVEMLDRATGKIVSLPRTILIDEDGTPYVTFSIPVFDFIKTMFAIVREPNNWPAAIPLKITPEKAALGSFHKVSLVTSKTK